jgi:hypothetical protein
MTLLGMRRMALLGMCRLTTSSRMSRVAVLLTRRLTGVLNDATALGSLRVLLGVYVDLLGVNMDLLGMHVDLLGSLRVLLRVRMTLLGMLVTMLRVRVTLLRVRRVGLMMNGSLAA